MLRLIYFIAEPYIERDLYLPGRPVMSFSAFNSGWQWQCHVPNTLSCSSGRGIFCNLPWKMGWCGVFAPCLLRGIQGSANKFDELDIRPKMKLPSDGGKCVGPELSVRAEIRKRPKEHVSFRALIHQVGRLSMTWCPGSCMIR